jgi:putative transposase
MIARQRVARLLGLSDRQIRRKLRRYLQLKSPEAFLPQRRGPMPGSTYLDPQIERLVNEEIIRALKHSPDIAADDLHPMLAAAAIELHLRPPSRDTVSRRLRHARREPRNMPTNIGRELEYRNSPVQRSIEVDRPLSVVEMDHTVCDVHIVDAQRGYPIGRPVLSMMIDRKTRVILGLLLSLEAPSRLSVGLCMHHGVFHKISWLTELGIPDATWPGFGLPSVLYTDNARDFTANSLRRAAEIYSIKQMFRPLGDPAAGGIIERAIGTFMTKVRLLPGTSYSKLLKAKPFRADRSGRFTLGELSLYIARQVSIYHKTKHDGIEMPPLTAWEQGLLIDRRPVLPRLPENADKFLITFLPGDWRTVTREGIELFSLRYQSSDLYPFIQPDRRYMVRYDPRNISSVYLEIPTGHLKVPLCEPCVPAFSLWEWREIKRRLGHEGRSRDLIRIAEETRANRILIESKANEKGRWRDVRRIERARSWTSASPDTGKGNRVMKSSPLDTIPICRVKG